jgi:hexosaminidase
MNAYLLDDTVRSSDPKVIKPLLQKFMDNIIEHAIMHDLQPILWEEMLLDYNLTLPSANDIGSKSDVILQVWRNSKNLIRVLERGYRVLFGDHEYWYLDCGYGAFLNPYPEGFSPPGVPYNSSGGRRSRLKAPYLDYCSPMNNWRHIYSYNPLVNISEDLYHLIQGGEVLLWSEQTDSVDLDAKLWPRAAAAAEVLWSGPRKSTMIDEAERRLAEWREREVIDQKIRAGPVGMTWCLMEGRCHY